MSDRSDQSDEFDVSVHIAAAYANDRAGDEAAAIGHYDAAWRLGLPSGERKRFQLGYGSTLRNVGRIAESVAILQSASAEFPGDRALVAFLALALHAAGRPAEAMALLLDVALSLADHAPDLAVYSRALGEYRDHLRTPGQPAL